MKDRREGNNEKKADSFISHMVQMKESIDWKQSK